MGIQGIHCKTCLLSALGIAALGFMLSSCVVYEPYYYPASQYDRVWDSALRAAEDVGITVTQANRTNGTIAGRKGPVDVTIDVQTQADGNIRVQLKSKGPEGADPSLNERFTQAYQRYMGR